MCQRHMIFILTGLIFQTWGLTLALSETERTITKSLVEHLFIKNCILVSSTSDKLTVFNDFKLMSSWNISTNVKNPAEVDKYVNTDLYPFISSGSRGTNSRTWERTKKLLMPKTMVLFQNPDLKLIKDLFRTYKTGQTSPYFTWLIITEKPIEPSIDIGVPYNTELIFVQKINLTFYKLTEVYEMKIQGETFKTDYGFWDEKNGLVTLNSSFYERRIDMKGTLVTIEGNSRITHFSDYIMNACHWKILEDMAKMMNISFKVELGEGKRFPTILEVFYDMMAEHFVKDAVGPIFKIKSWIYIKQPNIVGKADYFILPFNHNLWYSILSTIVLLAIAAVFIHRKLRFYTNETNLTLIDSAFMPLETFCNQFGSVTPKNSSGRILILLVGFSTVVLTAAYSGELYTFLIHRTIRPPFEDLQGLIEDESFTKGVERQGLEIYYIRVKAAYHEEFYRRANDSFEVLNDTSEAINRICQENFAYLVGEHTIESTTANCVLYKINNAVIETFTSIMFNEHSFGIKEGFSYKLLTRAFIRMASTSILFFVIFCRLLNFTLTIPAPEKVIIKSLIDHFQISHCILSRNAESEMEYFKDMKTFSDWNVPATVFSIFQLENYFSKQFPVRNRFNTGLGTHSDFWKEQIKKVNARTMIIFQISDITQLVSLLWKDYVQLGAGHFTWVVFLSAKISRFSIGLLKPPYNSEFIIIYVNQPEIYQLTEKNHGGEIENVINTYHTEIMNDFIKIMNFGEQKQNRPAIGGIAILGPPRNSWELNPQFSKQKPIISVIIAASFMAQYYERDLFGPILRFRLYMYIKQPQLLASADYFISPFDSDLWFSLLLSLLLITLMAAYIHIYFHQEIKKEKIQLIDSIFWPFEISCNQSGSDEFKNWSWKILNISTRLLCLTLLYAYSGELCSYLTHRSSIPPFENVEGFIKNGKFSLGTDERSFERFHFRLFNDSYYSLISKIYLEKNLASDNMYGINRVCKETYAHLLYDYDARHMNPNCSILRIKQEVFTRFTAIRFGMYTGFRDILFYRLLWFYSSGIIQRMQKELDGSEIAKLEDPYLPVEINQIYYLLSIIGVGVVLSFTLHIVEIYYKFSLSPRCTQFYKKHVNNHYVIEY